MRVSGGLYREAEQDRYPAIGDYAVIGDCRTAALVCRDGSIEWTCFPNFSGPSVFAALLDRERGGSFILRPAGDACTRRRYLPDTAVLETTFETGTGSAVLLDAMSVLNESPGVLDPEIEILRRIEIVAGEVELEIRYEPRPDMANGPPISDPPRASAGQFRIAAA